MNLLIKGEKAIKLMGVNPESLGAKEVEFDPASLSVRLLEGQPDLYWIRYEYRRTWEPGVARIVHRRDLLARKGDAKESVLDQWTQPSYEFSRADVYWNRSDDTAFRYQGSSLSVTKTQVMDKVWDSPPISFQETCKEECDCPPNSSGKPCQEKGCHERCVRKVLADLNSEYAFDKTVRTIDVGTGRVISEKKYWTKEYVPLQYQFAMRNGEAGLSFLVVDDSMTGWLFVRNHPVNKQEAKNGHESLRPIPGNSQTGPENARIDPENPGNIPVIAACWLYNRLPWDKANETRLYPPAPPDQVRPSHYVPVDCCSVEISADGKRAFLFEKVKDSRQGEKAGRLLASYDGTTQNCYSANLGKDGRWGRAPLDWVGNPVFNADGSKLAYRARQDNHWFVVVNDQRGLEFERVGSPVFSPDGKHLAYWAKQGKKEFIVLDDQPGPTFDSAGFPVFSPDSGKMAYRAREGKQWFVMLGDQKGPTFDDIGYYTTPDSARGTDIADVVFSSDGRQLAYAVRRGQQWFIVPDGQLGPAFEHVGLPVFSPDGQFAYGARQNDREYILLGDRKGPEFDFVGNPVFSSDGKKMAYWAQQGEVEFIMNGEQKGPEFDRVGAPVFNHDSSQVLYWARRREKTKAETDPNGYVRKEFIMAGEKKGPEFDSIESPVFNPETSKIAYRVRSGDKEFVMLGDQKGPEFDLADNYGRHSSRIALGPDGRLPAYRAIERGKEFIQFGEQKGPEFSEVGDPVFSPDGARLAHRARQGQQESPQEFWFVEVSALEGEKTGAWARTVATSNVTLSKAVPRWLPHPLVTEGGQIIGGATKSRWIDTDVFTPTDLEGGQCRPLNQESLPGGLSFKLYGFDKPLGECDGGPASVCISGSSGTTHLSVDFPGCVVKDFKIAVAAPWNALPRPPKVIKDHQAYQPIVRKLLDGKGFKQAPIHIESIHGIDLDGDGKEEFVINARSRKDLPEDRSAKDYSVVLLVNYVNRKSDAIPISEGWWTQENEGDFEKFQDIRYADVNGDGIMEIFVDWSISAEFGTRVFTLKDGKPLATSLGFYEGD